MKQIDSNEWYVVFDGTSYYVLMDFDIEDAIKEDPDIEVVAGPGNEEDIDELCNNLNEQI